MEAAVLKAHRAGMRYDAIRAEVATVGDRVRIAQRVQVLDHDRRDEVQPRLTGQQLAQLPPISYTHPTLPTTSAA